MYIYSTVHVHICEMQAGECIVTLLSFYLRCGSVSTEYDNEIDR